MPHRPHLPLLFRCICQLDLRLAIFAKGKDARSSSPMDHVASPPSPLPSSHRTTLLPSSDSREHCRCRRARHVSFSRVQSPLPPPFSSFLSHFFVWPLLSSPQTRPVTPLLEVNVTNVGNERERAPTSLSPAPYLDGSGMGRCDAEWPSGSPRNLGDESGGRRRRRSVCTFAGPRGREKAAGRTDGRRRALFVPMIAAADVAPSDSERFAFVPPALFSVFAVDKVAKCLLFSSFGLWTKVENSEFNRCTVEMSGFLPTRFHELEEGISKNHFQS